MISRRFTPITLTIVFIAALGHGRRQPVAEMFTMTGVLSDVDGGTALEREFVVPPGTVQLDVDLSCARQDPDTYLDFGIRGPAGIRGWSSSRNDHVHIDAVSASYGYLAGFIEAGAWHVMLGAVPPGDLETPFQITIRLSTRPGSPRPVLHDGPGWFAGDLHVHSGHSDGYSSDRPGNRVPVFVHDLATIAEAAHLEFLAVTDHNTASHWIDVDRAQAASPDLLLLHGREITTARGHFNAIGERRFTDFRLSLARPMRRLLAEVARDGAFLSINHAWVPADAWCAGCAWVDRDDDTIGEVAGIEVLNGSTPAPAPDGDPPGWRLWAAFLNRGARMVAVGGSDVHDPSGGRAALGRPSTVVWASALSEDAIVGGLQSGRVFVRAIPDRTGFIDLSAFDGRTSVTMGQTIAAGRLTLTAHITGSAGQRCLWIRRGTVVQWADISGDDQVVALSVEAVSGDWFSVVARDDRQQWRLISNAVYVQH